MRIGDGSCLKVPPAQTVDMVYSLGSKQWRGLDQWVSDDQKTVGVG